MLLHARERSRGEAIDLVDLPQLFIPAELGGSSGRWSQASSPGPVWKFDPSFCKRAAKHFELELFPGLSDDEVRDAMERITYGSAIAAEEKPEQRFFRKVPKALDALVLATRKRKHTSLNLKARIEKAKTWEEAANIAREIWYRAKIREGKTHKQLAAILGITQQALGQRLRKHGVTSLRSWKRNDVSSGRAGGSASPQGT